MITNPKDFFQQIQNLCEEVALKIKAISSSLSSYLTKADAEATYLDKTEAANTYLGKDEKAASATVADSATSANKATKDANGDNIANTYLKSATASSTYLTKSDAQATYLGKDAKAQSATFADSATTATSANSALKATQDGDGNVISGTYLKNTNAESTYLKKSDASSTYLGKTAKAESAKTADTATSATKATQDGNGAVISSTYLKTTTASSTYLTKSDAATTYLGKDAKAQSATFADSATTATNANSALKATQDGDGNVISSTYLKTAPVTSVNGQVGDVTIENAFPKINASPISVNTTPTDGTTYTYTMPSDGLVELSCTAGVGRSHHVQSGGDNYDDYEYYENEGNTILSVKVGGISLCPSKTVTKDSQSYSAIFLAQKNQKIEVLCDRTTTNSSYISNAIPHSFKATVYPHG